MRPILLTGFDRFGTLRSNPSQRVVEAIADRAHPALATHVLPTEYLAAERRLRLLIRRLRPRAVLGLGVARRRTTIALERIAVNIDDSELADNRDRVRRGRAIARGGPVGYGSTLPLERMRRRLTAAGYPAEISNHAGTFLCNHAFYVAAHTLAQDGIDARCGFVHLPIPRQPKASTGLTVEQMIEAVEICLALL